MPPTLARTLRSTNAIESMIGICREHANNVKHWRDGQLAIRWCAAGMLEASKQFRHVNVAEQTISTDRHHQTVNAA